MGTYDQRSIPFPIKGGKLYLYNNNPLLIYKYPGVTGMKTGQTEAAGRCLVATAERHGVRLGRDRCSTPKTPAPRPASCSTSASRTSTTSRSCPRRRSRRASDGPDGQAA